jgi:DNA helicase-2/ATP-dependent DNA helicase PcrA
MQRTSRYARTGRQTGGVGGYSVVGLPGKGTGEVDVQPGWTPPSVPGVTRREVPAIVAGDTVQHERWGEGVVVTTSGYGDDAEATIRFGEVGEKRVLLSYAPITKVG